MNRKIELIVEDCEFSEFKSLLENAMYSEDPFIDQNVAENFLKKIEEK